MSPTRPKSAPAPSVTHILLHFQTIHHPGMVGLKEAHVVRVRAPEVPRSVVHVVRFPRTASASATVDGHHAVGHEPMGDELVHGVVREAVMYQCMDSFNRHPSS